MRPASWPYAPGMRRPGRPFSPSSSPRSWRSRCAGRPRGCAPGRVDGDHPDRRLDFRREQTWISVFVVAVAILLAAVLEEARPWASLAYIAGAVASGSAGTVGIRIASLANARTAHAARDGTGPPLLVAFRGGGVMGLTVTGTSLLGFGLVYMVLVRWLAVVRWALRSQPRTQPKPAARSQHSTASRGNNTYFAIEERR